MTTSSDDYPKVSGTDCNDGTVVSASKIHMLGLDAIKKRLGPKWDRMSDFVHRYFEAALRREMGPGDTFRSSGELSYLLLFRDLTLAEAQLKCGIVVEEVCHKLFGEHDEEISIRSLVAPVDLVDLNDVNNHSKLNDILERDGRETLFSSKDKNDQDAGPTLRVEMASASRPLHTVRTKQASFIYRPLWDTTRNAVLIYICQLLPDSVRAETPISGPFSAENDDGQIEIDLLCIRDCFRRVADLRKNGLRILVAAPIHFTTLCRQRHWVRYRALCASMPPEFFRDIAFLLYGFDRGVPHIRLTQEFPKLTRISQHLFCLVDDGEGAGLRFRNTGAHAVGVALYPEAPEKPWIERVLGLTREAQGEVDVFVLGATARSAAINAIGAGARYLEGMAVRRPVADPRNGYVQDIDGLFRNIS